MTATGTTYENLSREEFLDVVNQVTFEYQKLKHELDQLQQLIPGSKHERVISSGTSEQLALGLDIDAITQLEATIQSVSDTRTYQPQVTEAMERLAMHSNNIILTARVSKLRDKPSVEKGVDLTFKWVYTPLRNETFQLNAAFRRQLDLFHAHSFKIKQEAISMHPW